MPINIEPGLFEWLAWYHDGMPVWMTLDELSAAGFNLNHSYDPLICREELKDTHESCEQYYGRSAYVSQSIINTTQAQGVCLSVCEKDMHQVTYRISVKSVLSCLHISLYLNLEVIDSC